MKKLPEFSRKYLQNSKLLLRTELKSLLRSCAFSAAVLLCRASVNADEYELRVVPITGNEQALFQISGDEQFKILCVNVDKCQTHEVSVVRNLRKKEVFLQRPSVCKAIANLDTPEDHTSFSFTIGSFKFCFTFNSNGSVIGITGGDGSDSLQIQNLIDNQTFEIDAIKANMLSITRGSYKTEVIKMHNCNINTVLLVDYYNPYNERPFLQTIGKNYILNLILMQAHILNRGMIKVDGVFCNIDSLIEGNLPSVILPYNNNCSGNACVFRDKDLVNNGSTLEEVNSMCKTDCTVFSENSDSDKNSNSNEKSKLIVRRNGSCYELPENGCYRFILLGKFKCNEKSCRYWLLRKEDFHPRALLPEIFKTTLRALTTPSSTLYQGGALVSLFKNVKSVNLQIGKEKGPLDFDFELCELGYAPMGHALVIIRERNEIPPQDAQEESFNEINWNNWNQSIYQR